MYVSTCDPTFRWISLNTITTFKYLFSETCLHNTTRHSPITTQKHKMEVFVFPTGTTIIIFFLSVLLAVIPWYLLNKLWLKPKRFEKLLKAQGFLGEPYNLSVLKDNSKQHYMLQLQQEDKSKSVGLSKEAAPYIFNHVHQTVHKYGTLITLPFYFVHTPI